MLDEDDLDESWYWYDSEMYSLDCPKCGKRSWQSDSVFTNEVECSCGYQFKNEDF